MAERIGIGILCYYGLDDVQAAVASVWEHATEPYTLLVFDNSENFEIGTWIRDEARAAGAVDYVRSPYNVGCSVARNEIVAWFAARGIGHPIVQDQDIAWAGDVGRAMLDVFEQYPSDTGVVSWHLMTRQMGPGYKVDPTGVIPEVPGACCMYSQACVRAAGGWNKEMMLFRFDTLFCLMAAKAGYKTRLVWPDTGLVRHNHPHRGVRRNPRHGAEQERSKRIFAEEVAKHGLAVPAGL